MFPKKMHDVLHTKVILVLLEWSMEYQQHTNRREYGMSEECAYLRNLKGSQLKAIIIHLVNITPKDRKSVV